MNKSKHGFFCNCNTCKCKRRNSGCYLAFLGFWLLIIVYQSFLLIFFTVTSYAILLFIEIILFFVLLIRIIL